jgi:hypothetical protein
MAMRLRIPALLALALALCALPGVRAFADAICPPCCAERAGSAPDPACALQDSDCCDLVPAAPAAPAEPAKAQPPAPALVSVPHAVAPVPIARLAAQGSREVAAAVSPLQLSVVRLL